MNAPAKFADLEVGYDVPAAIGMDESEIQTPCLILDLDALERNIRKMGDYAKAHGMRHRVHGKMHKSADIARRQIEIGGALGICCQKASEAEAFARGGCVTPAQLVGAPQQPGQWYVGRKGCGASEMFIGILIASGAGERFAQPGVGVGTVWVSSYGLF